ncbi:AAA family ATPase, partial [Escherichia coli]|uniref:AAA family ATPase n=2 Tax=Enterobacteriaceae TaxID=543 RepID=UPI001E4016C0
MIRNIYIKNFKTLNMTSYIELKECSFLCGANSSGKSSLIQTLLMLAQTFSNRYQDDSMVLNGSLARLGSFTDIKKHNSTEEVITIGFTFDVDEAYYLRDNTINSIRCEFVIGRRDRSVAKIDEDYHPIIISAKYFISKGGNNKQQDYIHFQCSGDYFYSKEVVYDVVSFNTSEYNDLKKRFPSLKILSIAKSGDLIPSLINIQYDKTKKESYEIINFLTRKHSTQ